MDPTLVIVGAVLFAVFGLLGTIAARRQLRRRDELAAVAARHGFRFSVDDPFDCTRIAFDLFRRGDGRGAENVMWRDDPEALALRAFDYWYYREHHSAQPAAPGMPPSRSVRRSYRRHSCVLAQVNSAWPDIAIEHEGLLDKLLTGLGMPDVDLESDEFNRTFAVRCHDARFATALLDPGMMDFLLKTRGRLSFAVKGRWLLVATEQVRPSVVPGLLAVADEFVRRVPRVVWELYPTPFVDEEGNQLPAGDEAYGLLREIQRHEKAMGDTVPPFGTQPVNPFEALHEHLEHDGVEYDLDGQPIERRSEDPWGPAAED